MAEDGEVRTSFRFYCLTCLFGISIYFNIHVLWSELPVLQLLLPEAGSLPIYLLAFLQGGNIAPVAYLITRKCSNRKMDDVPYIYIVLIITFVSLVVIGGFWSRTNVIMTSQHSIAFLLSVAAVSLVNCLSPITHFSFIRRVKPKYVTALLVGEGIGMLIPQTLSVAQIFNLPPMCGVEEKPLVTPASAMVIPQLPPRHGLNDTIAHLGPYHEPLRDAGAVDPQLNLPIRISVSWYFYSNAVIAVISALAFVVIRYAPNFAVHYMENCVNLNNVELELTQSDGANGDNIWPDCEGFIILEDGSVRHPARKQSTGTIVRVARNHPSASVHPRLNHVVPDDDSDLQSDSSSDAEQSVRNQASRLCKHKHIRRNADKPKRAQPESIIGNSTPNINRTPNATRVNFPPSETPPKPKSGLPENFALLMVVALWTSAVIYGPLSPVKSFSCFSLSNNTFAIGSLMVDLIMVLTCIVAYKLASANQMTILVAFTTLGTILLTYFVALVSFSYFSESRGNSPIFGKTGEFLAALAWVAIVGLFSFARVSISVLCRNSLDKSALLWFAGMIQLGNVIGSFCTTYDISVCQVFNTNTADICGDDGS